MHGDSMKRAVLLNREIVQIVVHHKRPRVDVTKLLSRPRVEMPSHRKIPGVNLPRFWRADGAVDIIIPTVVLVFPDRALQTEIPWFAGALPKK